MHRLIRNILLLTAIVSPGPLATNPSRAEPGLLPVQGYLTDAAGDPIDGTVAMGFRLVSPGAADPWFDTLSVDVSAGFFTAYLGSGASPLDLDIFATHPGLLLATKVGMDAEMSPIPLGFAAYAAYAAVCGDANTLDGASLADLAINAGAGLTLSSGTFAADKVVIEGWARGVCFDTPSELTEELDSRYLLAPADSERLGGVFAGGCNAGEFVVGVAPDGVIVCGPENTGATYVGGDGIAIDDTTVSLAAPTETTLGGVRSSRCVTGSVVTGVDTDGNLVCTVKPGPKPQTFAVHYAAFSALSLHSWCMYSSSSSFGVAAGLASYSGGTCGGTTRRLEAALPLPVGAHITGLACTAQGATSSKKVILYNTDGTGTVAASVVATLSVGSGNSAFATATMDVDVTVSAGRFVYLAYEASVNTTSNDRFLGCHVTWTPPADD